ncbi:hypothetical protein ES708_04336 [subsurface metagenome]
MVANGSSNPWATSMVMMKAPQPLKGIIMLDGAEDESAMYASLSRGIRSLSNNGRYKVPTVSTEMLDSTNISIPVNQARNWITIRLLPVLRASYFSNKRLIRMMNPSTPPDRWMKTIKAPTRALNIMVRV